MENTSESSTSVSVVSVKIYEEWSVINLNYILNLSGANRRDKERDGGRQGCDLRLKVADHNNQTLRLNSHWARSQSF